MGEDFSQKFFRTLWEHLRPGGRDLGETIRSSINFAPRWYIRIGDWSIPVTGAMISLALSVVILIAMGFWLRRGIRKYRITGKQALAEKLYLTVIRLCESFGMNREQAETVLPWTLTLGLYIFFSNAVAVAELPASAVNPAVPFSLAIFALFLIIAMGLRLLGLKNFWYSLIDPIPGLLPFNLLDYLIKPVSLALRLFGNVFGAFILLGFVKTVMPLVLPSILGLWFDVADGVIQGVIFMYLTTSYIGEVVEKSNSTAERIAQKRQSLQEKKA
ncbi:MAG TPA: FoF1 ATP synthase subunit a [Bacillota bacterium]|nr:FoF1 ATP synthase subunit a [Bacillota bacterium]